MSADGLTIERRGDVMVLHLDDGKANALTFELIVALGDALRVAEADPSVGAVVIHGREGRFSAGFDLAVMTGGDLGAIIRLVADGGQLVHDLYGSSVPVVAACTGHALAAGALVLLGCDVRIGADVDAKVGLNEVAIKMVLPDWAFTIAADRLSRRHLQRSVATRAHHHAARRRRRRLPRRGRTGRRAARPSGRRRCRPRRNARPVGVRTHRVEAARRGARHDGRPGRRRPRRRQQPDRLTRSDRR